VRVTLIALTLAAMAPVAEAQTDATAITGSIVFLAAPELPPTVGAGLIDALEAQLTGTGTTLHWQAMTSVGTDLRAAIEQGKPAAARHSAAGVFWLDASGASDWLLYLMDASGDRILVRRMEGAAAAPGASVEAIAVIVRESTAALSAGRPIAMDALQPPAPITPPPPPLEPPVIAAVIAPAPPPTVARLSIATARTQAPGRLRFGIGYVGSPLSKNVPWQHGLGLQIAAFTQSGFFVGVAYTVLPTLAVRGDGFTLGLNRRPVRLFFGVASKLNRHLRVDTEAGAILDVVTRTTLSAPTGATRNDDDTRRIFGAGLGARLNWTPQPGLDVFVTMGVEGFLNRADYAIQRNSNRITLLSPWPVSPMVEVGVAFRP
jgi:opacity protein-like surface antigen